MSRPFIPVLFTCSVELIYSFQTQVIENVLHVQSNAPMSLSDLQAIRGVFDNWDSLSWKTARCTDSQLVRIKTKALDALNSPFEDYSLPTPRAGTSGSAPLPGNVTFAFKLASAFTGRSARGRLYMPGLAASNTSGGYANSGWVVYAQSKLQMLPGLLAAANPNWQWVITSYRTDKAWRTYGKNFVITNVTYTDLALDCQRRRLPGRGRS
jgi:hypothetical protein